MPKACKGQRNIILKIFLFLKFAPQHQEPNSYKVNCGAYSALNLGNTNFYNFFRGLYNFILVSLRVLPGL